jgi:enoyl-CoA hydratase
VAVKAIQSTLRDTDMLTDTEAFAIEGKYGQAVFASEDAQEGPRAFLEKRKPEFKGR